LRSSPNLRHAKPEPCAPSPTVIVSYAKAYEGCWIDHTSDPRPTTSLPDDSWPTSHVPDDVQPIDTMEEDVCESSRSGPVMAGGDDPKTSASIPGLDGGAAALCDDRLPTCASRPSGVVWV